MRSSDGLSFLQRFLRRPPTIRGERQGEGADLRSLMMRLSSALALAVALAACSNDPDPAPVLPAPGSSVGADTPLGAGPESEIPADSVVTPEILPVPDPDSPASPPPADPPAVDPPRTEPPAPPRSEPPPDPTPDPPARADRSAAEAFWTRFQGALRARDASAIDDYLHTTVRVGGQDYDRNGPQVQEVVRQFAENPDLTEAYLDTSADELVVTDGRATFSSVARYTLAGEPYEVTVSGVLCEVSPGTWRIVELASEPR